VSVGQDKGLTESKAIGVELQNLVNDEWRNRLQNNYRIESHLDIEFETLFSQFFMPTIRGKEIGTKKRYAGLVADLDNLGNEPKLIFKGLESVRTDWTQLAKDFQRTLYLKVFTGEAVDDYINETVLKVCNGDFDDKLVYRKRIRRNLADYVKNVPPHVKAARLADELNKKNGKPLQYQQRGWIEYYITLSGPQVIEQVSAPLDYQFYIDKQLTAVADAILPFINTSFNQITDKQLGLF
jgi:DNA polymerase-2